MAENRQVQQNSTKEEGAEGEGEFNEPWLDDWEGTTGVEDSPAGGYGRGKDTTTSCGDEGADSSVCEPPQLISSSSSSYSSSSSSSSSSTRLLLLESLSSFQPSAV